MSQLSSLSSQGWGTSRPRTLSVRNTYCLSFFFAVKWVDKQMSRTMATILHSVHLDCSWETSYGQPFVPTWSAMLHVPQGNAAGQWYHLSFLRPRLHVSGSSGYPAPDSPFVYTYPGQMYAIRSITVRYPERFENDFKGGQPGCLDPFSSSVNGVPGYPDRFWIQFSIFNSTVYLHSLLIIWSFSINFCFRLSLLSLSPPSLVKNNFSTDRYRYRQFC